MIGDVEMGRLNHERREVRIGALLEDLVRDLRHGLRMLRKSPGFAAVAVLTLGLGIGANTAIFSLVNGILLRPLPYPEPNRLVRVTGFWPPGAVAALRHQSRTMDLASFLEGAELNLTGYGEAVRLSGTFVAANLFGVLGARAELGRVFQTGEDAPGRDRLVILSHALWLRKFGEDRGVIGRWITLDGMDRQVVGVMPSDFSFASVQSDVWVPLHLDPSNRDEFWHDDFMPVVGRLRAGANLVEARADLRALRSYVLTIFPWRMPDNWNADTSVIGLQQETVDDVRTKLLALLGAVGLILLIACANVANLLLARSATRQKEIALRAALGSGRWRIVRQLLTESVVLALAGGLLGLVFAAAGLSLLKATLPAGTPRLAEVALDGRVLGFTAALAVLTGLIFGSAPAVYASRAELAESLKTGWLRSTGGVSRRLCSGIVAAEVALAVVVVTGAGLLIRSFWRLTHVDPGFQTERILTTRLTPSKSFCEAPGRCMSFYNNLLTQLSGLPGVTDAAAINILPLSGSVSGSPISIEDHPVAPGQPAPIAWQSAITPRYLHAMGIQLLQGRVFTEADASEAPPVVLVSASTARRFWASQNPVGRHIKPVWQDRWQTVVGVVSDVRQYDMAQETPDWVDGGVVYIPYAQALRDSRLPTSAMTLVLRTSRDGLQVAGELRRLVAGLNSNVPVSEARAMADIVSASVTVPRSTMRLFVVFAALALALACVGIYSVLAYAVTQRTHEIGVRMTLGARPRDLLQQVMGEGMFLALAGLGIGVAGALALTRFLASLLYGVRPTDPITFLAVSLVLTGVALAACYLPARGATRVDPLVAMRCQ